MDEMISTDIPFMKSPMMFGIKLARYKFSAKMLSCQDIVLDLGCGNGYGAFFFSHFAKRVFGVDIAIDAKKLSAKWARENIEFLNGDINDLPPAVLSQAFDSIVSLDVIEHLPKENGVAMVRQSRDILNERGLLILGAPSTHSRKYRSQQSKDQHLYEYDPEELREICEKFFPRTLLFTMNDEMVHTGFSKLAWYFFILCFK